MKILLYDLETAPALGYFWPDRLYEKDIIEVKEDGYILGFGYMWAHLPSEVHWVGQPDFGAFKRDKKNDHGVVKELHRLVNEADFYIAHNGKNFDNKVANTSFLLHGLGPPDLPYAHDTKQLFKQRFRLPSNKLDEIGRILKLGRKTPHTGKKLWFDCMEGDPDAWAVMEEYCKNDVVLLKEVWDIVRPWMNNPPNMNLNGDRPKCCPACGSAAFRKVGMDYTSTSVRQKYQCSRNECRHIWRGEVVKKITSTHYADLDKRAKPYARRRR